PTKRWRRDTHGWPWNPISIGFNQPDHPWGFGRNVLAINPKTKKVLWSYQEDKPVDGRAICMKDGRIYIFSFGEYLTCLNAKDGSVIWRNTPDNAGDLFKALGEYSHRQDWRTNWRTTCYLQCSDKALYFAGPQINKLLAVSAEDGSVLWENAYNNFQLVLRDDELYGLSGQIDKHPSVKFAALTGEILGQVNQVRRACTRPTGSADAIFFRAEGGSVRLDVASDHPQWISPMRPPCQDGVTIANGLLYWWPFVCDCQLTLYGITSLGPAGDFDFYPTATEAEHLERGGNITRVADLPESSGDWPTFRGDSTCSATTEATVPENGTLLWRFKPDEKDSAAAALPTAPVAAGGLVFLGGGDGLVRALDATTGRVRWKAYTGGAIRIPPAISQGRAFVGSGDGWVYALEAKTGRLLWRFRAAPQERRMPVYGALLSTWPVASGALVEDGVAYVAAGIANYDGTYVYALDAATGRIKWQNNTSGHLDREARTGVSVQGHQLLHNGKLYLASGTSVSPAVYNAASGKCLNDPGPLARCESRSPRGCELSLLADQVVACGKPFYTDPKLDVFDTTVFDRVFLSEAADRDIVWVTTQKDKNVLCFSRIDRELLARKMSEPGNRFHLDWRRLGVKGEPLWSYNCADSVAVAACRNAAVVAEKTKVVVLDIKDGKVLWSQPIPSSPVTWGLAVDRDGRIIVTLDDGEVLCFGRSGRV
ncbi:MAG: PQQ-binding-like beta-propeller repeat protein, partial [Phycisphaerales bacterium]